MFVFSFFVFSQNVHSKIHAIVKNCEKDCWGYVLANVRQELEIQTPHEDTLILPMELEIVSPIQMALFAMAPNDLYFQNLIIEDITNKEIRGIKYNFNGKYLDIKIPNLHQKLR